MSNDPMSAGVAPKTRSHEQKLMFVKSIDGSARRAFHPVVLQCDYVDPDVDR